MQTCKFCAETFDSKFCPNCGKPKNIKRIDRHFIVHELIHTIFHVDGGIFYTIKELAVRPGESVRKYIDGEKERFKHFKPFGFLVITSLIYGFVSHYLGFHEPKTEESNGVVITWLENHNGYANLISIAFIAVGLRYVFYRNQSFNIFEYFVALSFITGQVMLLGVIAKGLSGLFHSEIPGNIYLLLLFFYYAWALGGFFKSTTFSGYLKAFGVYAACLITFMIFLLITDAIIGF